MTHPVPTRRVSDLSREAQGFAGGLGRAQEGRPLSSLFAARTMRLRAGRTAEWAAGYLSGLLIGTESAEVADMLEQADDIWLIGDGRLSTLYAEALGRRGLAAQALAGAACSRAGLGLSWPPPHPPGDPS